MIGLPAKASLKLLLARGLCAPRLDRMLSAAHMAHLRRRFVRVVNYHDTPVASRANLETHLAFYRKHYAPVGYEELDRLVTHGEWRSNRPGLVISFDDGLRSNYAVAAPLLERFGFVGWFFLPSDFIDASTTHQAAFARDRQISCNPADWPDGRMAMSWGEVRDLGARHVIGCHTRSHRRLGSLAQPQLDREIGEAKRVLADRLGRSVDVFCWVGGEEQSYSVAAAQRIRDAGFRMAFMTCSHPVTARTNPLALQRTNIEADEPLELLRLQLCGVTDWVNAPKRRRVERLTGCSP